MIIVFGSVNMDMIVPVDRFPVAGETLLGWDYEMTPGGKGANQALAAARTGAKVALVGKTGDDGMGNRILNGLRRDGVITSGVGRSDKPTGMAVIITIPGGEHQIIVAPGANSEATSDQIPDEILRPGGVVLLQMETPPAQNADLLRRAHTRGVTTILNLAPALTLPEDVLPCLDYLIVNQIEARQMAQSLNLPASDDAAGLARVLSQKGKFTCIVTMGAAGSAAATTDGKIIQVPALKLDKYVDNTGAGDAYCGTLAGVIYQKKSLPLAMRMASVAASLSCLKKGAQDSYAYLGDIEDTLPALGDAVISNV